MTSAQLRIVFAAVLGTAFVSAAPAVAAPCSATFGADFVGAYACNSLGTPTDVTGSLGGVAFLDANTLLIGGNANGGDGYIAAIGVTRDADNHIIGFSGPSTTYTSAPNIDGGLAFGPGGVLFATGYPSNTLLQFAPGATTPSRIDALPSGLSSVGSLTFVPNGFAGAGTFKLLSYNNGSLFDGMLTPDGSGTFAITTTDTGIDLGGAPEGLLYVDGGNVGFGVDSLIVSEYGAGRVGVYQLDAAGNPVTSTRRDFLTGLAGAEGATFDPVSGDFLFSTFGGGNQLLVVSGFTAPSAVPEPASWAMLILGVGATGAALRRRPRSATAHA